MNNSKPGAFTVNRNNELTAHLPYLKEKQKTSNNTTALYRTVEDYMFLLSENKMLKSKIDKSKEILELLSIKSEAESKLKTLTL